eukprot:365240-Chlamydomonas_euryale.AAC.8
MALCHKGQWTSTANTRIWDGAHASIPPPSQKARSQAVAVAALNPRPGTMLLAATSSQVVSPPPGQLVVKIWPP